MYARREFWCNLLLCRRIREAGCAAPVMDRGSVVNDRRPAALKPIDEAGSLIAALVVVEAMPPGLEKMERGRDLGGEVRM